MKKKYSVLGALGFFLVLFFQNCGKAPNSDGGFPAGVSAQQYNKYTAEGFSTLSMWDYVRNRFLDLNLETGEVIAFEEAGDVRGESFQLSAEKLSEVKAILQGAEICEPVINPEDREGRLCAMAYRYPYAVFMEQGEEVRLGEKADSCDIPIDLCGEKATQLQSWTKSYVESL